MNVPLTASAEPAVREPAGAELARFLRAAGLSDARLFSATPSRLTFVSPGDGPMVAALALELIEDGDVARIEMSRHGGPHGVVMTGPRERVASVFAQGAAMRPKALAAWIDEASPVLSLAALGGMGLLGTDPDRLVFLARTCLPYYILLDRKGDGARVVLRRDGYDDFVILSGDKESVARAWLVATRDYRKQSRPELIADSRSGMTLIAAIGAVVVLGLMHLVGAPPHAAAAAVVAGLLAWGWIMLATPNRIDRHHPGAPGDPATRT